MGAVPQQQWGSDTRVAAAKAQASQSLGVAESGITVVSVENVRWNNGALGCPQPDMAYTQAIVEGYRIVLEHDGKRHAFHGRTGADPFLCTPAP